MEELVLSDQNALWGCMRLLAARTASLAEPMVLKWHVS